MQDSATILVWGVMVHLIADWLLQTDWMALNKVNLRHPAAWVHSGIHTLLYLLVFSWYLALLIGITHLLIDTRVPVRWWIQNVKKMPDGSNSTAVEMVIDQVFHITVLAAVALVGS